MAWSQTWRTHVKPLSERPTSLSLSSLSEWAMQISQICRSWMETMASCGHRRASLSSGTLCNSSLSETSKRSVCLSICRLLCLYLFTFKLLDIWLLSHRGFCTSELFFFRVMSSKLKKSNQEDQLHNTTNAICFVDYKFWAKEFCRRNLMVLCSILAVLRTPVVLTEVVLRICCSHFLRLGATEHQWFHWSFGSPNLLLLHFYPSLLLNSLMLILLNFAIVWDHFAYHCCSLFCNSIIWLVSHIYWI